MSGRKFRFYTADVFTERQFGGNPLAVFPWAEGLSAQEMQRIANEFNLSETVFLLPAGKSSHTRRARIFTPATELPFAGHPTVGSAIVLAAIGEVDLQDGAGTIVLEEGVGPISIAVRRSEDTWYAQFSVAKLPEMGPASPIEAVAAALGLEEEDLDLEGPGVRAASCGVPFLYIPIKRLATVQGLRVNPGACDTLIQGAWASLLYPFSRETLDTDADIHARMFAPRLGVMEDAATGSAAAAIAGVLAPVDEGSSGTFRWQIEQGYEIGRPSAIEVEADLDRGRIRAVRVGGNAVMLTEGELRLD